MKAKDKNNIPNLQHSNKLKVIAAIPKLMALLIVKRSRRGGMKRQTQSPGQRSRAFSNLSATK
jgi:hypothetical protein